jgi:hypothetical protein
MTSRYGILCLVLFFVVLGLGFKNYETWSQSAGAVIKREVPKKPEARTDSPAAAAAPAETTPREAYKPISEKNIFHPERQEFPVTGAEQAKSSARPQITLYGVIVAGEYQSATIVNPNKPTVKGEREARTVKVGDRIGDYKVAKIQEDRIVMESSGDSFEVLLYDPNAPKRRVEVKTPTQPVAVTSSAGGPSPAPGSPAPPVPAIPRAPAGTPPVIPPMTPSMTPAPGAQPTPPIPMPTPQVATPRPSDLTPGTAIQPPQPTPSPTTPGTGIFRGRRPVRQAEPTTPQGN